MSESPEIELSPLNFYSNLDDLIILLLKSDRNDRKTSFKSLHAILIFLNSKRFQKFQRLLSKSQKQISKYYSNL